MMDDEKMPVEAEELVNKILDGIANGNLDMEMKDSYFPERVCIIEGLPFRKFDLLSFVCVLIDENKLEDAENLLNMTNGLYLPDRYSKSYERLSDALRDLIIYEEMRKNEVYYQEIFKVHCSEILGSEYKIFDKKDLKPKRPDAWVVNDDNLIIPVEMKKHHFNSDALRQLEEYMQLYGCSHGIAIGDKLTTLLPDNIMFVPLDKIKAFD